MLVVGFGGTLAALLIYAGEPKNGRPPQHLAASPSAGHNASNLPSELGSPDAAASSSLRAETRPGAARRPATPPREMAPFESVTLECPQVTESSGVAASRLRPGVFWTHNDSGHGPDLFSFELTGKHLGCHQIVGAKSVDWEDMAAVVLNDVPYLVVGDTGNNGSQTRSTFELYFVREPESPAQRLPLAGTVRFTYSQTAPDCEAFGIDPATGTVLLVAKNYFSQATVYSFPLPANFPEPSDEISTAMPIGQILVPGATGMDISADGLRLVVGSYANAFQWRRTPDESWTQAFKRPAQEILIPARKQGEAVCYELDGRRICLTSESRPTPFIRVQLSESAINDPSARTDNSP
ncbi:MAG: hypothetical protein KDA60_18970 [Planctomycetales bacterium]|nr:hypothetical protein [Planctomycetales bacterium]